MATKTKSTVNLGKLLKTAREGMKYKEKLDFFMYGSYNGADGDMLWKQEERERGVFHPSDMLAGCPRLLYYEKHYPRYESKHGANDPQLLRVYHNGDMMHIRHQTYWWHQGLLYGWYWCVVCDHHWWDTSPFVCPKCGCSRGLRYKEVPFSDEDLNVVGKSDGIIVKPDVIMELKSARSESFNNMVKKGVLDSYRRQVQFYMHFLEKDHAVFFIENKNDQDIYEEHVRYDEPYMKKSIAVVEYALECVHNEVVPRQICSTAQQGRQMYCRYVTHCFYGKEKPHGKQSQQSDVKAKIKAKIAAKKSGATSSPAKQESIFRRSYPEFE